MKNINKLTKQELIKLADKEIYEWKKFKEELEKKIKVVKK